MSSLYRHILLIDDDADDREIFLAALEKIPIALPCTVLPDAKTALQKLVEGTVTPDIIFLDLNMPVMNGPEFLSEIKKRDGLKEIPVVILSTSSQPASIELTKELGAKDFITKPNRFDELVLCLQEMLT